MAYPQLFNSKQEYNSYLSCLKSLRRGDKVIVKTRDSKYEGHFIALDLSNPTDASNPNNRYYREEDNYIHARVLIGTDNKDKKIGWFRAPYIEDRAIISEAIMGKMYPKVERKKVAWINFDTKITQIIKYDAEAENLERKAKNAARLNAKKAKKAP